MRDRKVCPVAANRNNSIVDWVVCLNEQRNDISEEISKRIYSKYPGCLGCRSLVSFLSEDEGVAFLPRVSLYTPDTSGSPVSEDVCVEHHGA